jgi:hypothetical protein
MHGPIRASAALIGRKTGLARRKTGKSICLDRAVHAPARTDFAKWHVPKDEQLLHVTG